MSEMPLALFCLIITYCCVVRTVYLSITRATFREWVSTDIQATLLLLPSAVKDQYELCLSLSRGHAQLHKEEQPLAVTGWFLVQWRVSERCHLQWTDSCGGVAGKWSMMSCCFAGCRGSDEGRQICSVSTYWLVALVLQYN